LCESVLADLRGPGVRQELIELLDRVRRDARQHIPEPGERIEFVEFARTDEAAQDGHRLATAITAEKGPVVAAHCNAAKRALGPVVVDGQIAVFEIARER
jgi:hypothetical protein